MASAALPQASGVTFACECAAIGSLLAAVFLVEILAVVPPTVRGFACDDDSIKMPYVPQKVTTGHLILATFVVPLLLVTAGELLLCYWRDDGRAGRRRKSSHGAAGDGRLRSFARSKAYNIILVYVATYGCALLTTDVLKVLVGRLRPHFLALCRPDWAIVGHDCSPRYVNVSLFVQPHMVHCRNGDAKAVGDGRMSMPSGHTSLCTLACVFLMFYLERRPTARLGRHVCVLMLQFALFTYYTWVSVTRIVDYYHRLSDVAVGAVIGASYAAAALYWLWPSAFTQRTRDGDDDTRQQSVVQNGTIQPLAVFNAEHGKLDADRVNIVKATYTYLIHHTCSRFVAELSLEIYDW